MPAPSTDLMKTFGSLSLGSRLKRLSDRLIQDVVEIYQAQGIQLSPTFFPLFNLLHQQGAQAVTEAAEQLGVSHPAISKIARNMLNEGWISKTSDPKDERRQLLTLTSQSDALVTEIAPIWHEIKHYLDQVIAEQQHPLLEALDDFEQRIQQQGFVQPVLANLHHRIRESDIEIIGWDASLREHFCQLNFEWLQEFFDGELTDHDKRALYSPESYYLAKGGYIWFARCNQEIVGCVALAHQGNALFEISKMGVDPNLQGFGIGRKLLLTALDKARDMDAKEVYLESATKLTRAIRLYRHLGFHEVSHPAGQSIYPRSDIYMTLTL